MIQNWQTSSVYFSISSKAKTFCLPRAAQRVLTCPWSSGHAQICACCAPPLNFFPQMHPNKCNLITCLNSMQKPQWPHCLRGTAAHFIGQYWGFHFKTAWSAEQIPNLRSIWQPDGFHLILTDFTKTPTSHDSDLTTVAGIVWLAAKAC